MGLYENIMAMKIKALKIEALKHGFKIHTYIIAEMNVSTREETCCPVKRYTFREKEDSSRCYFTALGIMQARIWLMGYIQGKEIENEGKNLFERH